MSKKPELILIFLALVFTAGIFIFDSINSPSNLPLKPAVTLEAVTQTVSVKSGAVNMVNINSDNINEIMSLTDIGEVKAGAIIDYRKEHGDFTDLSQLKNVKGITSEIIEKNKDRIYISP